MNEGVVILILFVASLLIYGGVKRISGRGLGRNFGITAARPEDRTHGVPVLMGRNPFLYLFVAGSGGISVPSILGRFRL
jgi:hypothetical protein